jgi:hypothetical protein
MVGEVSKALAQDGAIKAANTKLQIATMAKDQAGIDAANAEIAARTKVIQAQVQSQMNSMKSGSPAPAAPVAPPPAAPNNPATSAQYIWDPKQNKLVPAGQ